ncbi:MAG: aminotransferase class III-fold pyridoxal phosphate-dependent enzyme [candidate division Zixibacteria bacterium]|nr:aminotransferase class III-fold pyridoxal phosphate-dependent enzyme [candidate division Zixibacteria bacterium]
MEVLEKERTLITERSFEESENYLRRAEGLIPAYTQTLSKGPTQFVRGHSPIYLARGEGSHVFDVDGNEYIDYPLGLGPVTLGHNYPAVTEAMERQMHDGLTYSLMHPMEVELAEMLCEIIPCCDSVRYSKTGSEVTSAAIRIARAYNGREIVASQGYHGWHEWYAVTTERDHGIPKVMKNYIETFNYNDIDNLKAIFEKHPDNVSCVIIEPVSVEEPTDNFLEQVRELCDHYKAVLIFDEIVTGFRIALGGAQEYYGITPDLATFGKGMANGMPLSVVVGKKEIMSACEKAFFSTTFGGEVLSMVACSATIREMKKKNVIDHLWRMGKKLQDGYNDLTDKYSIPSKCIGLAPHNAFTFTDESGEVSYPLKSLFLRETIKRGVLFSGVQNFCFSHTVEDIENTLRAVEESFEFISEILKTGRLESEIGDKVIRPVFRNL